MLFAYEKETGAKIQIGQVIRFWDEYVKLKELMAEGKLGKVINANFRRISPIPTWGWNDWLLDESLSGGAAQDLHIHDIDYVLSLFGEPKDILSAKNTLGGKNSYINSLMTYDDFVVTVEGTWALPGTQAAINRPTISSRFVGATATAFVKWRIPSIRVAV